MPQLGETVAEGKITKWFKSAGDAVKPGDNLFEIETDKTSMEVPSTTAGTLSEIRFNVGDVAKVGAVVAVISTSGTAPGLVPEGSKTVTSTPVIPAQAGSQSQGALSSSFREETQPVATTVSRSAPLDPFQEVRSPERNYGPARLASGTTVTPLARRLAGERGIDLTRVAGSGRHPNGRRCGPGQGFVRGDCL